MSPSTPSPSPRPSRAGSSLRSDAPVLPTPQIIVQDERLRRTGRGGTPEGVEQGLHERSGTPADRRRPRRFGRSRHAVVDRRRRGRPAPRQLPVPPRERRSEEPRLSDRPRRRSARQRAPRRGLAAARGGRRPADPADAGRRRPPTAPAASPREGRSPSPIVHEDDALLVVDKPAGMAVHGGSGISFGVIEQLRAARPDARFLELVHRLDRETSGLLIVAKKRSALVASARRLARRPRREALLSRASRARGPRRGGRSARRWSSSPAPTASAAFASPTPEDPDGMAGAHDLHISSSASRPGRRRLRACSTWS